MDQPLITEVIKLTLNHGVYVTREAKNVIEATAAYEEWQPHLAVIDMDLGGDRLVPRLTRPGEGDVPRTPVLALTRRGDLPTKLAAFEQGVDDIMTVPFSPEELLARVLVITRRTLGRELPLNPVISLGELEIDILHRRVRAGTSELHLTGLEQSLLYLLAANAGRVVTRDEILDALWGGGLRGREQRGRSSHSQPANQAPERLAQAPLHRYRAGAGLSLRTRVLGDG